MDGENPTLVLHRLSPDGEEGYPGNLDVTVTYTLTADNRLSIRYEATTDKTTPLNLTNHSYFNLNGHDSGDILRHRVWLDADSFTRADETSIPTGEILSEEGTPMDFRSPKTVGRDIAQDYEALNFGQGYDHNSCLNNGGRFAKIATLEADKTELKMDVYTDLPGVQIYTGNFIHNEPGKNGAVYCRRAGICFETQYYPDSVNHPNFPSPVFQAGEIYETTTEFRFI
jgi:aldose 1-epimerase